jgi:hypothetical protein
LAGDNSFNVQEVSPDHGADLRDDIAEIFGTLVASQAQIYSIAAAGTENPAIINLFIANFFPRWVMFYGITKLGFDKSYKAENKELVDILTKADSDIKRFRKEKPTIGDVWSIIDTFNGYSPHVFDKSMIKIGS